MKITKKISKKKRWLINFIKQKLSIGKQKSKTVIINSVNNLSKKNFLISTYRLTCDIHVVNITIIDVDTYYSTCKLKIPQVFTISMKNLEF